MTDEPIRPLHTRIAEAQMNLATLPVEPEPLVYKSFTWELLADEPSESDEVRAQVIREALDDALAYHCTSTCEHLTEAMSYAVFAMGKVLCWACVYHQNHSEEAWEGPGEQGCTLCGDAAELGALYTKLSEAPDAMVYVAHVCGTCASWWPHRDPEAA